MPALTKRSPKFRLEFVANKTHSVHGGLPAVEALCQQFGLWEQLRCVPGLGCRKRKTQRYSGELMVAQLLYSLTSGGGSLADAERLNEEPLVKLLARVAYNILIALKLLHLPDDCQSCPGYPICSS